MKEMQSRFKGLKVPNDEPINTTVIANASRSTPIKNKTQSADQQKSLLMKNSKSSVGLRM